MFKFTYAKAPLVLGNKQHFDAAQLKGIIKTKNIKRATTSFDIYTNKGISHRDIRLLARLHDSRATERTSVLAGAEGFEPSARGFGDRCSTS